jgi:hypothetical protein
MRAGESPASKRILIWMRAPEAERAEIIGAAAHQRDTSLAHSGCEQLYFTDGVTTAMFLLIVALASWLPARRAASVDPIQAMRNESRATALLHACWTPAASNVVNNPNHTLSAIWCRSQGSVLKNAVALTDSISLSASLPGNLFPGHLLRFCFLLSTPFTDRTHLRKCARKARLKRL